MGVAYAGSLEFEEIDEAEETIDDFGLTRLTRKIGGPRNGLAAYLKTIKDGDQDSEFSDLSLVRRRLAISYDGPFAYVSVQFKGIRGEPKPKRTQGLIQKTVVLTNPNGATLVITYLAPFTTFRYASERRPRVPKYVGKKFKMDAGPKILDIEGTFDADLGLAGPSPNALNPTKDPNRFIYGEQIIQTVFDAEEEGNAWQVTETNEGRLVDARRTLPDKLRISRAF